VSLIYHGNMLSANSMMTLLKIRTRQIAFVPDKPSNCEIQYFPFTFFIFHQNKPKNNLQYFK